MTSQFPTALDNLSNPNGNDPLSSPGQILHSTQHTNANDVLEAIERKLGIGDSVPGSTAAVLRRTGTGTSGWGPVQTTDFDTSFNLGTAFSVLLDYKEATDLYSVASWANAVAQPFSGAKTFTVQGTGSLIEIAVRAGVYNSSAPATGSIPHSYLLIDGTTRYELGTGGSAFDNPFSGAQPVYISGLSAGPHTVQVFAMSLGTTAGWCCRPATVPGYEHFSIQVIEHKAGIGVKGEVGPSAQTAGGTKRQLTDTLTTDVSAVSIPVSTWTTVRGPITFNVDDAASLIELDLAVSCAAGQGATPSFVTSRVLIDGSISHSCGGSFTSASGFVNPFQGVSVWLTGLTPGPHTMTFQVNAVSAGHFFYCRPLAQSAYEWFIVTVNEHKQGGLAWVYKGPWSNGATYSQNDVVTYLGSSYVALQTHTNQNPATASAYWGLMAQKGDVAMVWKGPWSAATAYILNDVVTQGAATYIAIAPSTNLSPATNPASWSVLVASTGLVNPMTTADDLIVGGTSGVPVRLPKGPNNRVLTLGPTGMLEWSTASSAMITDGTILGGDIADSAITTPKIADNTISTLKLQANSTMMSYEGTVFNGGGTAGPWNYAGGYVDTQIFEAGTVILVFFQGSVSNTVAAATYLGIGPSGSASSVTTQITVGLAAGYNVGFCILALFVGLPVAGHRFHAVYGQQAGTSTISNARMSAVVLRR